MKKIFGLFVCAFVFLFLLSACNKITSISNEEKLISNTGLNNILDEYMEKYNDYEANYHAVLNLPAVRNKINSLSNNNSNINSNTNTNSNSNSI